MYQITQVEQDVGMSNMQTRLYQYPVAAITNKREAELHL